MSSATGTTTVELDVIVTGEISTPHAYLYRAAGPLSMRLWAALRPGSERLRLPCIAYAVRHPSAGTILIDTGMHPDATNHLRRDFGIPMSLLFRGLQPAEKPFDEQLRALAIEPNDVERVIMTHLHVDHTSAMRLLPKAKFICARTEWLAAHKRFAAANGYVAHHLPPTSRTQLLDFASASEPYETFTQTIDLLGDGAIRLISTPGHTLGHLSVLLRHSNGCQVLLIGDAAYTLRSVHERILPMITADDRASLGSLEQIDAFSKRQPTAIMVPSHDPSAWRALASAEQTTGHTWQTANI